MKKQLFVIAFLCTAIGAKAQTFPNGGFENWINNGSFEEPQYWSGMNVMSMFGAPATATKSTSSHSGTYALKLTTSVSDFGGDGEMDTLPGIIMLGNSDLINGNSTMGTPFSARPDSLVGWYKLISPSNTPFQLQFISTKWNVSTQNADAISSGSFEGNASSNYIRFSVPILYLDNGTPDSIQVYLGNSTDESITTNQLFIDDLSFVYNNTAGVNEFSTDVSMAPNPFNHELRIQSEKRIKEIVIVDIQGKTIMNQITNESNTIIETSSFDSGIYYCSLLLEDGQIHQQKIIKQ
jgi:Secretion system C-terminal sorting domain